MLCKWPRASALGRETAQHNWVLAGGNWSQFPSSLGWRGGSCGAGCWQPRSWHGVSSLPSCSSPGFRAAWMHGPEAGAIFLLP